MLRLLVYITLFKVSLISSLPGHPKNNGYLQHPNRWASPQRSDFYNFINTVLMNQQCGKIPAPALEDLYNYMENILDSFVRKYCNNPRINRCERPQLFEDNTSNALSFENPSTILPTFESTTGVEIYFTESDESPQGNRRFGDGDGFKQKPPPQVYYPPRQMIPINDPRQPVWQPPWIRKLPRNRLVKRPIRVQQPKLIKKLKPQVVPEPDRSCVSNEIERETVPTVSVPSITSQKNEEIPLVEKEESSEGNTEPNVVLILNEPPLSVTVETTTEYIQNPINDPTTTQITHSSESQETVPPLTQVFTQTTRSYESSEESSNTTLKSSSEEVTQPSVPSTTPEPNYSRKDSSFQVPEDESDEPTGTQDPSLDSLTKDDIEKIWLNEYDENVSTPPTIEDLDKIYKKGVIYLKEHPEANQADLQNVLLKNPNELVQYQEVISLLDDLKHKPEEFETEYQQIKNNDDELKYKTAIAFLKLRQKSKPEKYRLLLGMLQKRTRELKAKEKKLKDKLKRLNEEFKKINSAYGKIQKEEAETKDKVVVAVMKVPVTVDDGKDNAEIAKVLNKFKHEIEKEHQIVAEEPVTVMKDNYSLTPDEKTLVINAAMNGIEAIKQGTNLQEFSVEDGTNIFFKVFDQLPVGYLESEQQIFGLNPYHDQTKSSTNISINPTRSLAAIRLKIINIVERLSRGEIKVNKQKFLKYLINILNLVIDKVQITPNKLIDNPQVSVFAAEESGNSSDESGSTSKQF